MSHFEFANPWALPLLLVIPLIAFLRGRYGREAAVQYSGLSLLGPLVRQRRSRAGGWLSALMYATLACLLLALARPQIIDSSSQVQSSGIDIMLAIDLSPSMEALDYHKNGQDLSRVDVVKDAVGKFIQERPNDRIGMVVFAGEAYLMSPLTLDHDWLLQNVDRLRVGLAGDATAIGSGLAVCANRLRDEPGKSKIIILLTDGSNNAGKITPYAAAQAAAALGIKIYTIGAGSADVAKFPVRDPFTGQRTYTTIPGRYRRGRAAENRRDRPREVLPRRRHRRDGARVRDDQQAREDQGRGQALRARHGVFPLRALSRPVLPRAGNRPVPHPLAEGAMNDFWTKLDPGFFEPVWLLVGLLAVIAIVLLEIGAHRRRREALRLFAAPHLLNALTGSVSTTRRLWKRLLLIGGVACVFIALARPHLFFRWQEEVRHGVDILFAVDCSKSMLTQDVKPSRLERAKLAISDFADQVPDDRLGLIDFAGDAFLQVPLTLDHEAFQTAVRELDTDSIPRPGTDIATAIDEAVLAFKSQAANAKILILVTDGEDLEGRAISAAQAAGKAGLKIYTIGVGTAQGDLIPETDDSGNTMYLHDADGNIVKSRLDEKTLKEIAADTGGAYAPLGQQAQGLQEIYQRYIAPGPKHAVESRRQKIEYEQYEWPLGLGILLLIGSMLLGERVGRSGEDAAMLPPARRRSHQTAAEVRRGGTGRQFYHAGQPRPAPPQPSRSSHCSWRSPRFPCTPPSPTRPSAITRRPNTRRRRKNTRTRWPSIPSATTSSSTWATPPIRRASIRRRRIPSAARWLRPISTCRRRPTII